MWLAYVCLYFSDCINDLVSVEGKYHKICRSSFENLVPEHQHKIRPPYFSNTEVSEKACEPFKDEMELYSVKQFYNKMFNGFYNTYSTKWVKMRLIQKYGNDTQFVTRQGQSYIILLSNINSLSNDKWYKLKETSWDEE